MLDLYNELTKEDIRLIDLYVKTFNASYELKSDPKTKKIRAKSNAEEIYGGSKRFLEHWAKEKKKLYRLLGGQMIYKVPISIEKEETLMELDFKKLHYSPEKGAISTLVYDKLKILAAEERISADNRRRIDKIFSSSVNYPYIVREYNSVKVKIEGFKGTLQIPIGLNRVKAYKKVVDYLFQDEPENLARLQAPLESIRLEESMILNDKIFNGNLCFSIHPLDFMSMSDNDSKWSSCMSWKKEGCYRAGTLEMMNSNNVICVYLEGKDSWTFNEIDYGEWNNKRFRQLFFIHKDIILGTKSYPYFNKALTTKALEVLRELAKKNMNWTYKYGPEVYHDMDTVGGIKAMEEYRRLAHTTLDKGGKIIFDTKGMYNDLLNNNNNDNLFFLCIRNNVPRTLILSVSGKCNCLNCGDSVVIQKDKNYDYIEDYNDRYLNTNSLYCEECSGEVTHFCQYCGEDKRTVYFSKDDPLASTESRHIGGEHYCLDCFKRIVAPCPCCGRVMVKPNYYHSQKKVFCILEDDYSKSEFNQHCISYNQTKEGDYYLLGMCGECKEKKIEEGILVPYVPDWGNATRMCWESEQTCYIFEGTKEEKWAMIDKYDARKLQPFDLSDQVANYENF